MKIKRIITGLVLLISLTGFNNSLDAQEKSAEYLVEATSIKELKKYKWKEVSKYFKDFDKKENITIRIKFTNADSDPEKKGKLENFDISLSGEARRAKDLTDKMKNLVEGLINKFWDVSSLEVKLISQTEIVLGIMGYDIQMIKGL